MTYLKLLGAVETAQKHVTDLQKEFNDWFLSSSSVEQKPSTVDDTMEENYYEGDDEMIDDPLIL